ncbi:DUF2786 domain-containing protein [Pseudomonas sp. HLMP]|uniref:DUF2786 domain-containing protein n=1 Tax=Pseudomonas sp. HLMP TaxID=3153767 RepID=UPI003966A652
MIHHNDNPDRERIIRKIQRCLDLSKSPNEHEAAAALRQAKKLMQMHRLTEMDVQLSSVGKAFSGKAKARLARWERHLGTTVARAFNCECILWYDDAPRHSQKLRVLFIGMSPAQEIAKYAYDTLRTKAATARRQYIKNLKTSQQSKGATHETRGNHFAEAWVGQVYQKLVAIAPASDDLPLPERNALALTEEKEKNLIAAFIKQLTEGYELSKGRNSSSGPVNPADIMAGRRAGSTVELHHGVTTGGTTAQMTYQRGAAA